jgi:hypothetical protein
VRVRAQANLNPPAKSAAPRPRPAIPPRAKREKPFLRKKKKRLFLNFFANEEVLVDEARSNVRYAGSRVKQKTPIEKKKIKKKKTKKTQNSKTKKTRGKTMHEKTKTTKKNKQNHNVRV